MGEVDKIGRLALRVEGDDWRAYYALNDTMGGALPLGSIRMSIARIPARKQAFMDLMRDAVADIIEEKVGVRPSWGGAERALKHEKAGRA